MTLTAAKSRAAAIDSQARPALEVRNLEVSYHRVFPVLQGVSLCVPAGSIVALLGPNGAGKTTTLRAISGLLQVHDGEIRKGRVLLHGEEATRVPAAHMVQRGLSQVLEGRQVFPGLTVEENLYAGAHTRRQSRQELADSLARIFERFPRLADRRDQAAGYLSGGEQQMLAIGRAWMAEPKVLLLDEPSLGLAPQLVSEVRDVIVGIQREGTTVLLVEQNAAMALSIAQHGYVMEQGKIVLDGPVARLLANDDIREFYLGLRGDDAGARYREVKHYRRRKRWLS